MRGGRVPINRLRRFLSETAEGFFLTQDVLFKLIVYLANFCAILISLPLHEFAHAYAAVKNGDSTPMAYGRYTLNPFRHFDPIGLVMMILLRFGWAKPVPINPCNFKDYKKGCVQVSLAGVAVNLILAFVFCPVMLVLFAKVPLKDGDVLLYLKYFIVMLSAAMFYLNVGLFVFNLLPLYPLDGFNFLSAVVRKKRDVIVFLRKYSLVILLAIFALGYIGDWLSIPYLDIIGILRDLVARPILLLWRLILGKWL